MSPSIEPAATRRDILLGAVTLAALPARAAAQGSDLGHVERLDPALDRLIDGTAPVEEVMSGFTWSEGPLWVGGRDGMLFVSDPEANMIRTFRPGVGDKVWLKPSGYDGPDLARIREPGSNGLALGRRGLVVADSGNRRITLIDLRNKVKTSVADRFEGKRFNSPNDVCISPRDGSMYFTDPPYGLAGVKNSPDREMDYTGVFRVGRDGAVSLIGKYDMPNGVGLSPDGGTLYHTDRAAGWVAHRLDPDGRSLGERPFIDLAAQGVTSSGDGMKVDGAGNLWASSREGMNIFSPAGRRLGVIHTTDTVSNCAIGGDGYLYMTNNHRVVRVRVKASAQRTPAHGIA